MVSRVMKLQMFDEPLEFAIATLEYDPVSDYIRKCKTNRAIHQSIDGHSTL